MVVNKYFSALPLILIVSAFGIYIGFGIRVDQLILYPSSVLFFLISALTKQKILKKYFNIFILWLFIVVVGLIVTIVTYSDGEIFKIIGDTESFVQPLALMVLFMFLTIKPSELNVSNQLQRAGKVLIVMLSLNTVFIFVSLFTDITRIGLYFWGGTEDLSVAARAMTNGRFSGIFNQPMEAGVMYSIGLLIWLYLSEKIRITKLRYIIGLCLIVIGGLITVSKVFLFGGLPLFFIGLLFNKKKSRMIFSLTFWLIMLGYIANLFLIKTWSGYDYLLRFSNSNENFIQLITAGRYGGQDSELSIYFSEVWHSSPIYGRGFGVTHTYDSGYFRVFAVGGSIDLIVYLVILLGFIVFGLKFLRQNRFKSESKLFVMLVILIIGSDFGSPTLTLHRITIVLWIFIGMLYQYYYAERQMIVQLHSKGCII